MTTTTTFTVWACPVCRQEVGVLWTSGPPVCSSPAHPQAVRRRGPVTMIATRLAT